MEKRALTEDEIEYVIDFVELNPDIHPRTAESIVKINKNRLREQLVYQLVYPPIIESLKVLMKKDYEESLINPGQSVGIICAQSIGERNTQNTLNTFHKAGQSEKSVLAGVPRFQEILNTTKDPKNPSCQIYFNEGNDDIKNLRDVINSTIVEIRFASLYDKFTIYNKKIDRDWYKLFDMLYSEEDWYSDYNDESFSCFVSFKIKREIVYKYKINYEDIAKSIKNSFGDDLCCVFSSDDIGIFDVFINTTDITLPEDRVEFIDTDNMNVIYIEECVIKELSNQLICGINGIENIYYTYNDKGEWFVDTDGSNYIEVLNLPTVDTGRTISNNMWEIYSVLGIEAVREFLIRECLEIMESINICHVKLLVERMTFSGSISSISRYTMRNDDSGPMSKASFEESTDNFLRAAYECELENTDGVSASIICGKKSKNGTGIMDLKLDIMNF